MNLIVSSSSSSSTAGQTTIQQSKEEAERRSSVHNVTAAECNKESTPNLTPSAIRRGVNVPVCSTGTPSVTVTVRTDEVTAASSSSRRRRSTFYVPLNSSDHSADDSLDLSACSLDWSLNESVSSDTATTTEEHKQVPRGPEAMEQQEENNYHRLEIAVNEGHDSDQPTTTSSTPIKAFGKSRSRTNILNLAERITLSPAVSPLKEKSKTLPQNLSSGSSSFPAKHSFLLKSSPKISAASPTVITASPSPPPQVIPLTAKSPRKSLSFIRRSHSTKVSRSSSLLRSFTRQQQQDPTQPEADGADQIPPRMVGLNAELLERLYRISVPGDFDESLRRIFFKERPEEDEDRITKGTATRRPFEGVSCVGGSSSSTAREEEDAIHSGNDIIIPLLLGWELITGFVCHWKWSSLLNYGSQVFQLDSV